jgi:hypothetical protein
MRGFVLVIGIALSLSACSALAPMAAKVLGGAASKGIEADAEVTIGQKKEDNDIQTDVQFGGGRSDTQTNNQQANEIANYTVKDYSLPAWVLISMIFLAGWAIPAPGVMFNGIANFIRKLWRK